MPELPYEHCCECDSRTGRAGRHDDSLFAGDYGPLCEECYDALIEAAPKIKRERDLLKTSVLAALKRGKLWQQKDGIRFRLRKHPYCGTSSHILRTAINEFATAAVRTQNPNQCTSGNVQAG